MNRTGRRLLRSGLGLLLLLGLAAAATWVILQSRPRSPQAAQGSPLATPTAWPPQPPSPTARPPGPPPLPAPAAGRVPLCAFPGGTPPERGGPGLDKYEFSEPRVVITNTFALDIAGWLPDSNRLLVIRSAPDGALIETVDVRSNARTVYGVQQSRGYGRPFWLPQAQAVAYLDYEWLDQRRGLTRDILWVGQGAPQQAQRAYDNVPPASVVIDPGGYLILFSGGAGQPPEAPEAARHFFQVQSLPFAPDEWRYPKYPASLSSNLRYQGFVAVRRPGGAHVAFYTDPYLFLFDNGQARVCEVDLGLGPGEDRSPRFPIAAKWSPNGRYLAMITTARFPGQLLTFSGLTVLDTVTGELSQPRLPTRYVTDIDWAPNSQHVLALGDTGEVKGRPEFRLLLVDPTTGDVRQMLPQRTWGVTGSQWGWQMAWSPNGRELAIKCPVVLDAEPTVVESRVCLISSHNPS